MTFAEAAKAVLADTRRAMTADRRERRCTHSRGDFALFFNQVDD